MSAEHAHGTPHGVITTRTTMPAARHLQRLHDRLRAVGDPDRHPVLAGDGRARSRAPATPPPSSSASPSAQIVVHMVYFLHMNAKAEDGWLLAD